MPTAIEFNNISKQYRLGLVSTKTISHDLNRWWQTSVLRKDDPYLKIGEVNNRATRGEGEYVWALRDIDFKVEQGDVLGIIGKNGAGKSTLLKILSKVTAPTTGSIRARGRIASLLEVGTGFHPEMTGRENIYMNGAIMGMTKREISRKLDEIIDFAGVERYIDTPTKRYSSGMTVRLGFAIAAHLDPEILVVDEVLAVGDAEFQKKAIGKMQDVSKGEGRTVLFVSHNMASMRQLCNNGILLGNGTVEYVGNIDSTCDYYLKNDLIDSLQASWKKIITEDKDFQLLEVDLLSDDNVLQNVFSCDENFRLVLTFSTKIKIPGIYGYLDFISEKDGNVIWVSDSNDFTNNKLEQLPIGISKVELIIPKRTIAAGSYKIRLNFTSRFYHGGFNVDSPGEVVRVEIHDYSTNRGDARLGYLSSLIDWDLKL